MRAGTSIVPGYRDRVLARCPTASGALVSALARLLVRARARAVVVR